jgi:tRNA pseudouridine38-40 synthase
VTTLFDPAAPDDQALDPAQDDPSDETAVIVSTGVETVRVRMTVAYDGAPYHGFASNDGVVTVAGTLEAVLAKLLHHPIELAIGGRTDRGVHGWGQVVSFDAPSARLDVGKLLRGVNRLCGPTIAARSIGLAPMDFDARFSATSRTYRYTVLNRPVPDPFLAATAWWVEQPLDIGALRLACDPLIGLHDFSAFCRRPKPTRAERAGEVELRPPTMLRRVHRAGWTDLDNDVLRFEITASAFCQQMVRAIVGTVVDMGLGRKRAGEMAGIIRGRDRAAAGNLAPPHGLCLWEVGYES